MSGNQKVLGIVSIVLGAFAIIFSFWYMVNIAAVVAAIAGLVLAIISRKGFAAANQQSPVPTIGLVLSIIGIVFSIIGLFTCTVCICTTAKSAVETAAIDPTFASNLSSALDSAFSSALQ